PGSGRRHTTTDPGYETGRSGPLGAADLAGTGTGRADSCGSSQRVECRTAPAAARIIRAPHGVGTGGAVSLGSFHLRRTLAGRCLAWSAPDEPRNRSRATRDRLWSAR